MMELNRDNFLLLAGIAVVALVFFVVLYYYYQYKVMRYQVGTFEKITGFDVPLLAPKKSRSREFLEREVRDPENQRKTKEFGMQALADLQDWRRNRSMRAPITEDRIDALTRDELRTIAKARGLPQSQATRAELLEDIREDMAREQAISPPPGMEVSRISASFKPLSAPHHFLSRLRSPRVDWENLGDRQGSVISASEDDGALTTNMMAQTSFQVKDAKAHSLDDGTLVVDGHNRGGRRFTLFSQSRPRNARLEED